MLATADAADCHVPARESRRQGVLAMCVFTGEQDMGLHTAARTDREKSALPQALQGMDTAPVLATRVVTGERDKGHSAVAWEDCGESSSV